MNRLYVSITGVIIVLIFSGCAWLFGPGEEQILEKTSLEILESHKTVLEARNAKLAAAGAEYATFSDAFMQTFAVEHKSGLSPQTLNIPMPPVKQTFSPKATVPVYYEEITFGDGETGTYLDYPEPGLTTGYEIAAAPGVAENVYRITVTTTYPASNTTLSHYIEEYYVLDVSLGSTEADEEWTYDDPIVDADGNPDQKYRTRMEMHFDDGSVRYETIVKMIFANAPGLNDGGQDEDGFAPFSILGSLDYPDLAYPVPDPDAGFSSVVVYTHEWDTPYNSTFWQGTDSQDIIGVRYYTEHSVDEGSRLKGTIVAYEKTVSTLASQDGTLLDQLQDLFVGSEHDTLAESVFRKEVVFESLEGAIVPEAVAMNSIMRSHVVDISSYSDAEIQLFNDDELKDLDWSGGTYYIPTGIGGEIEDVPSDDEVIYYEKEGTYVENPVDPYGALIETVEVTFQGPSDLAVLYRAITDEVVAGTVIGGEGNDIPGTIDGVGTVNIYDGNIGTAVADDPAHDLTTNGTVEAWVYMNAHENWGGIVHKGDEPDFSDEAYSLEFVDKKGKVGFAITQQDPDYLSKKVKSRIRLNLNAWYYVVGTWDESNLTIYVYGNDAGGNPVLLDSQSTTNTVGEPFESDGALLIGSQLLDDSESAHGYWGVNGKINGVKVSDVTKTEQQLLDHYLLYEDLTVNWVTDGAQS